MADVLASLYASIPSDRPIIAKCMIEAGREIEQLRARIAQLREDAARLDWLSENGARIGLKDPVVYYHELRSAVDMGRGAK